MDCGKLESLWIPYIDGKLSAGERKRMDAHVDECSECAARRAGLLATFQALENWEAPEPSPWFDARLRQRIAAEEAKNARLYPARWLAALSRSFPLGVAAVLLLAAMLVWSAGGSRAIPPRQMAGTVKVDDLLHVMDEVEMLSDFEVLGELDKSAAANDRIDTAPVR